MQVGERPRGDALVRRRRSAASRSGSGRPRSLSAGLIGALVLPRCAGPRAGLPLPRPRSCLARRLGGAPSSCASRGETLEAGDVEWTAARPAALVVCAASGLYLIAQVALLGFVVLFLARRARLLETARRRRSRRRAGRRASCASAPAAGRIVVGARMRPLRRIGRRDDRHARRWRRCSLDAPARRSSCPSFVVAGAALDGLERALLHGRRRARGPARSGAAIGFQQTVLSVAGVARPIAFAATVSRRRGARRSRSPRSSRSPAGGCCARSPSAAEVRSPPCACSSGSTSSTRSAAGPATRPRSERRTSSRPAWFVRRGSRGRGRRRREPARPRAGGGPRGRGRAPTSTRCRRAAASTARSASSRRSRRSSGSDGRRALAVVAFRGEEVGCVGSRARMPNRRGCPAPSSSSTSSKARGSRRAGAPLAVVPAIVGYARGEITIDRPRGARGHDADGPPRGRARRRGRAGARDQRRGTRDSRRGRDRRPADGRARRRQRRPLRGHLQRRRPRAGPRAARPPRRRDRLRADAPRRAGGDGRRPSARRLRAAIEELGLPAVELPSGAGHDAGILAAAGVPSAMLFVRSLNGGVSHSPDEHSPRGRPARRSTRSSSRCGGSRPPDAPPEPCDAGSASSSPVPDRGLVYGTAAAFTTSDGPHPAQPRDAGAGSPAASASRAGTAEPLLQPGKFTELFFLDEATAFAAGHRPCALCRREDYNRFGELWRGETGADAIDALLHAERLDGRGRRLHDADLGRAPGRCLRPPRGRAVARPRRRAPALDARRLQRAGAEATRADHTRHAAVARRDPRRGWHDRAALPAAAQTVDRLLPSNGARRAPRAASLEQVLDRQRFADALQRPADRRARGDVVETSASPRRPAIALTQSARRSRLAESAATPHERQPRASLVGGRNAVPPKASRSRRPTESERRRRRLPRGARRAAEPARGRSESSPSSRRRDPSSST